MWTRSLTRAVYRTVRLWTGASAGAPGLIRVDADTAPFGSKDAPPGSRACVRVRAFLARSGGPASRAFFGAPHLFLCPFLVLSLSARPPPGLGCAACGCSCVFCFFSFFSCAPPCLLRFVFPGPGCLGPWRLAPPPPSLVFFLSPPLCLFFFPVGFCFSFLSFFFPCRGVLVVRCSVLVCPGLWDVLVCVVVGLVLRRGLLCVCAPSFRNPCLCLFPLYCCLLYCACLVAPCWRRCSSPCCLWWVLCGVALPPPRVFCAGFFFACRVFAGCAPPPPPPAPDWL